MKNLQKWAQTIKISLSSRMAYRINFFLTFVGPVVIYYFVKYNLWTSIYLSQSQDVIGGRTLPEMIDYHVWVLVISFLAKGHASVDMAVDIRMGRISSYLIYPFNFWEFHTASFLSFQLIQTAVAFVTVIGLLSLGILPHVSWENFCLGVLFSFFVSALWFSVQYLIGLLAFWLEETWIMRSLFIIISSFLSGGIVPLDLFPPWFEEILLKTPFPYMTYYPVKIFQGEIDEFWPGLFQISLWVGLIWAVNTLLWRKGLRLYSGAGM